MTPSSAEAELAKLTEALDLCRAELAQVRGEQESLAEQRGKARRGRAQAQERLEDLTDRLAARLLAEDPATTGPADNPAGDQAPSGLVGRLRGRAAARPAAAAAGESGEDGDVRLIAASPLLDGGWYLRRHPEVVSTGLSPARHYLRHGAMQGLDPGPDFSTRGHLAAHPELAGSGVNPLLHHLRG